MDFFGNLFSNIGQGVSYAYQAVRDAGRNFANTIGNQSASVADAYAGRNPVSPPLTARGLDPIERGGQVEYNASTPSGPAYYSGGKIYQNTALGPRQVSASPPNSTPIDPTAPIYTPIQARPAIVPPPPAPMTPFNPTTSSDAPRIPTDQFGRSWNHPDPNQRPKYDEVGRPIQGYQGTQGGGTAFNVNVQGAQGGQGFGGPNFTGLLGSVGGISTPAVYGSSQEDKSREAGGISSRILSGPPLQVPSVPATVDVAAMQSQQAQNKSLVKTSQATSTNDYVQTKQQISDNIQQTKQQIEATTPTPPNPVVETDAQKEFLNSIPQQQQFDYKKMMDEMRLQVGLPGLETNRIELMKELQSTNEAFQAIYDDIKKNPNLPKGLAERRLRSLQNEQKTRITQLSGQLQIIAQQIDDANEQLSRNFKIVELKKNDEERQTDNARQTFSLLVNSGAVGALSDKELRSWGQQTGIQEPALRKVRDLANKPDVEIRGSVEQGLYQLTTDPKTGTVTTKKIMNPVKTAATNVAASPAENRTLQQADLTKSAADAQTFFLNTPKEFQDTFIRGVSTSGRNYIFSLQDIADNYEAWIKFEEDKKRSGIKGRIANIQIGK